MAYQYFFTINIANYFNCNYLSMGCDKGKCSPLSREFLDYVWSAYRSVLCSGRCVVLCIFRGDLDSDVFYHRYLGRTKQDLRCVKFFLYTLLGSLLALVALIYLYITTNSFSILDWHKFVLDLPVQLYLFAALFLAFAVKIPMWPVHTWLPDAHVEAPLAAQLF